MQQNGSLADGHSCVRDSANVELRPGPQASLGSAQAFGLSLLLERGWARALGLHHRGRRPCGHTCALLTADEPSSLLILTAGCPTCLHERVRWRQP